MILVVLNLFRRRKQCFWKNKDYDIPVTFVRVAGEFGGVKFAEVKYEEKTSYVPFDELVYKYV